MCVYCTQVTDWHCPLSVLAEEELQKNSQDLEREDDESYDFYLDDLHAPKQAAEKKRGLDRANAALRFPIWLTACHFNDFKYTLRVPGLKVKQTDFVNLGSLARTDSWAIQHHPELKYLTDHIIKYLRNFHSDDLSIPVSVVMVHRPTVILHATMYTSLVHITCTRNVYTSRVHTTCTHNMYTSLVHITCTHHLCTHHVHIHTAQWQHSGTNT